MPETMTTRRIAGMISLSVDGVIQNCEGDFEYNLGTPIRETLVGSDRVHGFSEKPQASFIKGNLRRMAGFDMKNFQNKDGVDAQLKLATGETFVFINGWVAGEGTVNTGAATFPFEFYASSAEAV